MASLSDYKQADIIEAFKSTPRYLDDFLNSEITVWFSGFNCQFIQGH